MRKIYSEWVKYNANSNNKNVGDCVKRSLSVAYSMDYNDVGKELNKIKRDLGYNKFNVYPVFSKFLQNRGDVFLTPSEDITVGDFCDLYNNGVYVLLCGKEPKSLSHMVSVVDGDYYDSWDSSRYYVYRYSVISSGSSESYDLDIEDLMYDCYGFLIDYVLETLSKKYKMYFYLDMNYDDLNIIDGYTFRGVIRIQFNDIPNNSDIMHKKFDIIYDRDGGNSFVGKYIIFKVNPRLSVEKNYESITKKSKTQVYNYIRGLGEILEMEKFSQQIKDSLPKFRGYVDYEELYKLPTICYNDVYEYCPKNYNYNNVYELTLLDGNDKVDFAFKDLRKLKKAIEHFYATGEILSEYDF